MQPSKGIFLGGLLLLLASASACGKADEPTLDQAIAIASHASLECGLGSQLKDTLWDAYTSLPVTIATQPHVQDAVASGHITISFDSNSFDSNSFQAKSRYFQFTFNVTSGSDTDIPYTLSFIRFVTAYQDRNCKETCVVAATYGDVSSSDRNSVRGTPLEFSCFQPSLIPGQTKSYEWRAIPVRSDVPGEIVAGFREITHASYKGHTVMLDIHPRGGDRFCVDGDCQSIDISSADLRSLYTERPNPATTYMPSRFFEDHPRVPSDPQGF